jgi:hypothetical protein
MNQHGLACLRSGQAALMRSLDGIFEAWGHADGAATVITPPLLPVESLARLDYYDNFPHQALLVSALAEPRPRARDLGLTAFPAAELQDAELALPPAACYAVYLDLAGQEVADGTLVTVIGRCFRREERYADLRRLLGFHMREIVAVGSAEFVEHHLDRYAARIFAFAKALDLPLDEQPATDPFFDRQSSRALLQRIAPVKHEFLAGDLAIASVNKHRNFFGERCGIRLAGTGGPVFTSCVAFGLERWLSALSSRFGSWDDAARAVDLAAD